MDFPPYCIWTHRDRTSNNEQTLLDCGHDAEAILSGHNQMMMPIDILTALSRSQVTNACCESIHPPSPSLCPFHLFSTPVTSGYDWAIHLRFITTWANHGRPDYLPFPKIGPVWEGHTASLTSKRVKTEKLSGPILLLPAKEKDPQRSSDPILYPWGL